MIGVDYGSYSFNAATSQVTLNLYGAAPKLEALLLITNVTDNIIIYNFANPTLGATLSGNTFTLDYSTVAMSNTDNLQVWYYTEEIAPNADLSECRIINQAIPDQSGRTRVIFDTNSSLNTVTSVTSVSTVSTVSTLSAIGIYNATPHIPYTMQIPIEIQMQKIVVT